MPTEYLADVGRNEDAAGEAGGGDGGTATRLETIHDVAGRALLLLLYFITTTILC